MFFELVMSDGIWLGRDEQPGNCQGLWVLLARLLINAGPLEEKVLVNT
jgi:hypothetical protein